MRDSDRQPAEIVRPAGCITTNRSQRPLTGNLVGVLAPDLDLIIKLDATISRSISKVVFALDLYTFLIFCCMLYCLVYNSYRVAICVFEVRRVPL